MERYELVLSHYYVDEDEINKEEIEEPYIASVDIKTLEDDMQFSKTNVLLSLCNELIKFINKEELENDTNNR